MFMYAWIVVVLLWHEQVECTRHAPTCGTIKNANTAVITVNGEIPTSRVKSCQINAYGTDRCGVDVHCSVRASARTDVGAMIFQDGHFNINISKGGLIKDHRCNLYSGSITVHVLPKTTRSVTCTFDGIKNVDTKQLCNAPPPPSAGSHQSAATLSVISAVLVSAFVSVI